MTRNIGGNIVLCQSGGPTAVINSSLVGVIDEARRHDGITGVYGAINGMLGVLSETFVDLTREKPSTISRLRTTPSAALGSSRYKLEENDVSKVIEIFERFDVRYFFINGGNGSMYTGDRIHRAARDRNYDLRVIGIPKTVDNDLIYTDHCPGYPSAGRWLAIATMDAGKDTEGSYTADPVKIIETMGRDTGWLAAATSLAKQREEDAPHLIYLPEAPFNLERFLEDVWGIHKSLGYALIVVGEGLRAEDGQLLAQSTHSSGLTSFGVCQPVGIAQYLSSMLAEHLNIRARFDKPGTIQRSSMTCVSKTDLEEAYMVGKMAVRYAVEGKSGFMVTLERSSSLNYEVKIGLVELGKVCNRVRKFPSEFISKDQNFVTSEFISYFKPLLGEELPNYAKLRRYPVMTSLFGDR